MFYQCNILLLSIIDLNKIKSDELYINLIAEFIGLIASIFIVYFIVERAINQQKKKEKKPLLEATKRKLTPILFRLISPIQTYTEKKKLCKNGKELKNLTKYFHEKYFFPYYSDLKSDMDISMYILPNSIQKNFVEILNGIEIFNRYINDVYFVMPDEIESESIDFSEIQLRCNKILNNIAKNINEISIEFEDDILKSISKITLQTFKDDNDFYSNLINNHL